MTSTSTAPRILVIGATSAMAQVAIRCWAGQGARLFLVGRDGARLDILVADVKARGGQAKAAVLDDFSGVASAALTVDAAWKSWDGLDGALIAHGWTPDNLSVADDPVTVAQVLRVNGESVCQFLSLLAPRFEGQGFGWMAAISSVAGDRGRAKMYVYGAAKAMVSHFLAGLRQRVGRSGVRVIDLRPGPVATPMTEGQDLPLIADVEKVGRKIARVCLHGNGTVYLPWFWRYIMLILRFIPERIWLKMRF